MNLLNHQKQLFSPEDDIEQGFNAIRDKLGSLFQLHREKISPENHSVFDNLVDPTEVPIIRNTFGYAQNRAQALSRRKIQSSISKI